MKKITSIALLFSLAVVVTLFMANKNKPVENDEAKENEKETFEDAQNYMNMLRFDMATGALNLDLYYQARIDVRNEMLNGTRSITPVWEEMGPDNIGGRCRAILFDKDDATHKHMFSGSVSGGLFESHDGGESWDRCSFSDGLSSMNVTCLTQAANGDIYFGTGETFGAFPATNVSGATGFPGDGIFKSTDHGATFTNVLAASTLSFSAVNGFISSLAADPVDGNKIYAATNSGLKVTTNGGTSWAAVTGLTAASFDVEIASDGTVHAVVGTKYWRKRPSDPNFIQATSVTAPGFPQTSIGRLNLAVCAGDPNYVYAIGTKVLDGLILGVWKSSNGGSNWTQIAGQSASATSTWCPVTQGAYALAIGVHPTNGNIVFIGGLDVYRYEPTGGWDKISYWVYSPIWSQYVHADLHAFAFDPGNPNAMFTCSDGGLSKTLDCTAAVPNFATKNKGFAVTQFYSCIGIPYEGSVLAGAQDNGTMLRDLTLPLGQNTPHQFNVVKGGDGGDVASSRLNRNIIFGEYVNGSIERSANKGQSFAAFFDTHIDNAAPTGEPDEGAEFIAPCLLWEKPGADTITNKTHKFFLGTNSGVWMTNNALLTSQNTNWFKLNRGHNTSSVISLAVAADGNCVYAGCGDGKVYRISGLDTAYAYHTNNIFYPDSIGLVTTLIETLGGAVTGLAVDPNNMHHVVATVGGYSGSHVYESMDADTAANPTFNNIQGSLTQMPVYSVAIGKDPANNQTTIIVGTELGVWSRQGATWTNVNDGVMPNVPVLKLRWVLSDPWNGSWLYASTYGRGVFRTSYFVPNVGVTNPNANQIAEINIYPNPVSAQTTISFNLDKPGDVIGSIYDLAGKMVARFAMKGVDGFNKQAISVADLTNGTYIVSMQTEAGTLNKKMIVAK